MWPRLSYHGTICGTTFWQGELQGVGTKKCKKPEVHFVNLPAGGAFLWCTGKQTAEKVTVVGDDESVDYYIDYENNFYVFDFNGEQEIYIDSAGPNYGKLEYTVIVRDNKGNIIDFAKGSLDHYPND